MEEATEQSLSSDSSEVAVGLDRDFLNFFRAGDLEMDLLDLDLLPFFALPPPLLLLEEEDFLLAVLFLDDPPPPLCLLDALLPLLLLLFLTGSAIANATA